MEEGCRVVAWCAVGSGGVEARRREEWYSTDLTDKIFTQKAHCLD